MYDKSDDHPCRSPPLLILAGPRAQFAVAALDRAAAGLVGTNQNSVPPGGLPMVALGRELVGGDGHNCRQSGRNRFIRCRFAVGADVEVNPPLYCCADLSEIVRVSPFVVRVAIGAASALVDGLRELPEPSPADSSVCVGAISDSEEAQHFTFRYLGDLFSGLMPPNATLAGGERFPVLTQPESCAVTAAVLIERAGRGASVLGGCH